MSSLVQELQREALDSSVLVSDLLRKALVVAKKLNIKEFDEWISLELKGYNGKDEIPSYRVLSGRPMARNPYHGWQPIIFSRSPQTAEDLSTCPINTPVGEIEAGLKSATKDTMLHFQLSKEVEANIIRALRFPLPIAVVIDKAQLHGILEAVKTIVLEWSVKLEQDGIIGEDMTFSKEEKQKASTATYHIKNYINEMSHSQIQQDTHDSVQTMSIQPLDLNEVSRMVQELRIFISQTALETEKRQEIEADIATVESQLRSPKPKSSIIRESFHSIRNILEGAVGSGLATGILYELARLAQ